MRAAAIYVIGALLCATAPAVPTALPAVSMAVGGSKPAAVRPGEAAPATATVSASAEPPMTQPSGMAGSFALPLPPPAVVLTPFRSPATRYGAGHRGVDLAASVGVDVRAAARGVVVYAGVLVDRGVVSVEHVGGLRTTYEPVDARVSVGDVVARGDLLGMVAAGHPSCAPASCLHLGARLPDRVYLDPMALFGAWRVRLKPWGGFGP